MKKCPAGHLVIESNEKKAKKGCERERKEGMMANGSVLSSLEKGLPGKEQPIRFA